MHSFRLVESKQGGIENMQESGPWGPSVDTTAQSVINVNAKI